MSHSQPENFESLSSQLFPFLSHVLHALPVGIQSFVIIGYCDYLYIWTARSTRLWVTPPRSDSSDYPTALRLQNVFSKCLNELSRQLVRFLLASTFSLQYLHCRPVAQPLCAYPTSWPLWLRVSWYLPVITWQIPTAFHKHEAAAILTICRALQLSNGRQSQGKHGLKM